MFIQFENMQNPKKNTQRKRNEEENFLTAKRLFFMLFQFMKNSSSWNENENENN